MSGRKSGPKSTVVAAYAGAFLLLVSMVAIGYQPPQRIEPVANATDAIQRTSPDQPSVDQLVATNVAAGIAERAELPVAVNIANLSVSLAVESELAQSSNNLITKPQIVQPTADGREMRKYVAKVGDNVQGVAARFGISPDTVKWANNLNSDALEENKELIVPPVDGVVYAVQQGDTVEALALKYKADAARIVTFNDLELSGLAPGKSIMIPGGVLPEAERPGYVAPRRGGGVVGGGFTPINANILRASAGNRYAGGNCTWYAFERRAALGRPIGSFWGNATTWASSARAAGFTVNNTPAPGAIAHWYAYQGGSFYAGHVGIVESVNPDGSITISEMNYLGNYNRTTSRTLSPSDVSTFIH